MSSTRSFARRLVAGRSRLLAGLLSAGMTATGSAGSPEGLAEEPAWTLGGGVPFPSREFIGREPVGSTIQFIAVDLDGDGTVELVGPDLESPSIWSARVRGGVIGVPRVVAAADQLTVPAMLAVATADLGGDGDADILAMSLGGDLVVFRNDGDGQLVPQEAFPLPFEPLSELVVPAIVVDRDGSAIAAVPAAGGGLFAVRITPTGRVVDAELVTSDPTYRAVRLDLDEDGREEFVTIGREQPIRWWRIGRDGGLEAGGAFDVVADHHDLDVTDIDGDGRLDVVATRFSAPLLPMFTVIRNLPGGAIAEVSESPPAPFFPGSSDAAFGDFDGDGVPDAVVSCLIHHPVDDGPEPYFEFGDRRLHLFRGRTLDDGVTPALEFAFRRNTMLGHGPVVAADVTGDGIDDIVQLQPLFEPSDAPLRGRLTVYAGGGPVVLGDVAGDIALDLKDLVVVPAVGERTRDLVAIAGLDGVRLVGIDEAGWPDEVAAQGYGLASADGVILMGAGASGAGAAIVAAVPSPRGLNLVRWSFDGRTLGPAAIAHLQDITGPALVPVVDDLDGDGQADAVAFDLTNLHVVLFGEDGEPTTSAVLAAPPGTYDVQSADFDDDGFADLVSGGLELGDPVGIWYGRGDGSFEPWCEIDVVGGWPEGFGVRVVDLDGDGRTDLLRGPAGEELPVARNAGGRVWERLPVRSVGPRVPPMRWAIVGDLDGDGTPDLAAIRSVDDSTVVGRISRDADGELILRRDHVPSGRILQLGPGWVRAGDFNGDGVADLVGVSFKCGIAIRLASPAPPSCSADFDRSGVVDFDDLLWWAASTGREADPIPPAADLDEDGRVGAGDLLQLLAAWGPCEQEQP
jgi:hypothetical protein